MVSNIIFTRNMPMTDTSVYSKDHDPLKCRLDLTEVKQSQGKDIHLLFGSTWYCIQKYIISMQLWSLKMGKPIYYTSFIMLKDITDPQDHTNLLKHTNIGRNYIKIATSTLDYALNASRLP